MSSPDVLDVVIVGAGPAGLGAAARAQECDLSYVLLERTNHLADTIHCYQRGKHVMAEPAAIPLRGEIQFDAGTREQVLGAWQTCVDQNGLNVKLSQSVTGVERQGDAFLVTTAQGTSYRARKVILAMGTQGNPNRLKVDGEDLPFVKRRLVDPSAVNDKDVVVVGAGDSAIEIANSLSNENRVSLVVRRSEIVRAKPANEREVLSRNAAGQLTIFFSSTTKYIEPGVIHLNGPDEDLVLKADLIYVQIGAQPPRRWLESLGVGFTSPAPDARPRISTTCESVDVPGLYLIGAITGRDLIKLGMNQGYEVIEDICGREVLPADEEILLERLPFFEGTVHERIVELKERVPLLADTDADQLEGVLLTVSFKPEEVMTAPEVNDLREAMLFVNPIHAAPGDVLMRQNDYTDSIMLLIDGKVEVLIERSEGGGEQRVAVLEKGSFFGEMGLISGRRRSATIRAVRESKVLELPRKTALKLMYTSPRVRRLIDEAFLIRAFRGYLFPNVPEEALRALAKTAEPVSLGRDEVLFEEGDESDGLYFIRSGQVKISKASAEHEVVLAYLVSGNFFGEPSLFNATHRAATVTAIFPTELIFLSRDSFRTFVFDNPELAPGFEEVFDNRRIDALAAEATPGKYEILDELIRGEVVIGTDALIIDDYKCIRCGNCVDACIDVHDDRQARLSLTGIHFANILAPNSCWQCENPLCMLDCPPDALVRDSRGEIYIKDNCIGCGNCEANCPYDNIFMVYPEPKRGVWGWIKKLSGGGGGGESGRSVAVKCDLCRNLAGGPACVRSCPTGAAVRLTPEAYEDTITELVARGRRGV